MTVHPGPWPPGTPAWADLMVTDLAPARRFYAAVLGWEYGEAPAPAGGTTYLMATTGGCCAAGLGDVRPDPDHPGAPGWTVYLATDDLSGTVDAAERAGATVVVPPVDVGDLGAFAVLEDPAGATFGLWRSGALTGFDVVDEPGAVTWCENLSDDCAVTRAFYADVFGCTCTDLGSPGLPYASFTVAGRTAGGIGRLSPGMGAGDLPHWLVYFSVEDVDDAVATVVRHGGTVTRAPWDTASGRIAVVMGPAEETFALHASRDVAVLAGRLSVDPA